MGSLFESGGAIDPDNQVYIVSYPKAGRTWVRVMLGHYLSKRYGFDEMEILGTHALTTAAGLLPTQFTHDHSAIVDGLDHRDLSLGQVGIPRKARRVPCAWPEGHAGLLLFSGDETG